MAVTARAGNHIISRSRPDAALRPVAKIFRRAVARFFVLGGCRWVALVSGGRILVRGVTAHQSSEPSAVPSARRWSSRRWRKFCFAAAFLADCGACFTGRSRWSSAAGFTPSSIFSSARNSPARWLEFRPRPAAAYAGRVRKFSRARAGVFQSHARRCAAGTGVSAHAAIFIFPSACTRAGFSG